MNYQYQQYKAPLTAFGIAGASWYGAQKLYSSSVNMVHKERQRLEKGQKNVHPPVIIPEKIVAAAKRREYLANACLGVSIFSFITGSWLLWSKRSPQQ